MMLRFAVPAPIVDGLRKAVDDWVVYKYSHPQGLYSLHFGRGLVHVQYKGKAISFLLSRFVLNAPHGKSGNGIRLEGKGDTLHLYALARPTPVALDAVLEGVPA